MQECDTDGDPLGERVAGEACSAIVLHGDHVDELAAAGDHVGELDGVVLGDLAQLRPDALGEQRQDGVDGIGLGEAAQRAGEVADLAWIDRDDRHLCGGEAGGDDAFEAAGGLEHDAFEVEGVQALDESVDAGLIVCDGERSVGRTQVEIEAVFETSRTLRWSSGQMVENVALVLGGGGSAGHAWTIGVIAGLAEAGIDMTEADLVIGTSSGATAAAHVRSGIPPAELFASILSEPVRPVGQTRQEPPYLPMCTVFERMRAIGAAATSAADLRRAMGAFGLESDAAIGPGAAEQRRVLVASRLPRQQWPDRPMIVVAVNAHTGELAAFDRDSGVDLVDAVAAGTALPGGAPTHDINGIRYINGGVHSAENADLAAGYANVVVLSPFGGRSGTLPAGQFEGLRRFPGADLASQVEALRKQGSRVEVITPDADSRAAMGTNQMDLSTRPPSARAGYTQGRVLAEQLTEFWR